MYIPSPQLVSAPGSILGQGFMLNQNWLLRIHGLFRGPKASLSFWLKLARVPSVGAGLLGGEIWRNGSLQIRVLSEGQLQIEVGEQGSLIGPPLPPGTWTFLTFIYDRTRNRMELWQDGTEVASSGLVGEGELDLDALILGGSRTAGCTEAIAGTIADVRISQRVWASSDIAGARRGENSPFHLSAWWIFDRLSRLGAHYQLQEPRQSLPPGESTPIRPDAVEGRDGSTGTMGAYLIPTDSMQPDPLLRPSDADFSIMGIHDLRRSMTSLTPAWSWECALPAGNGDHGALVLGRPLDEAIVLNRAGLFLPRYRPLPPVPQGVYLPAIRSELAKGQYQRAAELPVEISRNCGYEEKRWTDPFVPAAFLKIETSANGLCRDYRRGINYSTGVVAVRWTDEEGIHLRKTFVSRADNVVVTSITSPTNAKLTVKLALRPHDPMAAMDGPTPSAAIEHSSSQAEPGWLYCQQVYSHKWPGSLQGCESMARVIMKGGQSRVEGDQLEIINADSILVLALSQGSKEIAHSQVPELKERLDNLSDREDVLLERHEKLHRSIYDRTGLDIGGTLEEHRLSSEELFAKSALDCLHPVLLEKAFLSCRYLALSSSGPHFPPNLQGVWGGTWRPSWSADYTQNGNLQCAIAGHCCGNMPEALEGFFQYLDSQMDEYRENARALFKARGIHIPSRTSSHGMNNHFDATWPMTFWTAGAAWNAHFYFDYWQYTQDRKLLIERAIPFMREAAHFYEDFLIKGTDGFYHFSPSYSPENDSPSSLSQSCTDAAMDVAAARELLSNLVMVCQREHMHSDEIPHWQEVLRHLPPYRINSEGAVAEWGDPKLADRYEHRHASHLYALYDGLPEEIAQNRELREAMQRAIERRMIHRRRAGGGIMAFGMVQLGAAAASLQLAQDAYEIISWLTNRFWIPQSMVTTHNPRSVFNIDIAGGLPRLIMLMLVDSQPGLLRLLPALPSQWPTGRIEGIRCRGAITLNLNWDPQGARATLTSLHHQILALHLPGQADLQIHSGAGKLVRGSNHWSVCLEADRPCTIDLKWTGR